MRLTPNPGGDAGPAGAPSRTSNRLRRRRRAIIAAGIVPAALEMMDNLTIQAVEPAYHAGYPMDAGAVLADRDRRDRAKMCRHRSKRSPPSAAQAGAHRGSDRHRTGRAGPALEGAQDGARRRWAASRRTTTCTTPSCPAPNCRPHSSGSKRSPGSSICRSRTSSTLATAICIR